MGRYGAQTLLLALAFVLLASCGDPARGSMSAARPAAASPNVLQIPNGSITIAPHGEGAVAPRPSSGGNDGVMIIENESDVPMQAHFDNGIVITVAAELALATEQGDQGSPCRPLPVGLDSIVCPAITEAPSTLRLTAVTASAIFPVRSAATYPQGWNLVALQPLTPIDGAMSPIYAYADGQYYPYAHTSIVAPCCYWVDLPAGGSVALQQWVPDTREYRVPAQIWTPIGNATNRAAVVEGADMLLAYEPTSQQWLPVQSLAPGQAAVAYRYIAGTVTVSNVTP